MSLGAIHPDYLLSQLTSRQLAEWMAFYKLAPFGQEVSDGVTAQVAALIYNVNRGKHVEPVKATDFLPRSRAQQQTPEQMKHLLRSVIGGNRQKH